MKTRIMGSVTWRNNRTGHESVRVVRPFVAKASTPWTEVVDEACARTHPSTGAWDYVTDDLYEEGEA